MGKLEGSTLIEALTAGTIILLCSALSAMIYSNVLRSQNTAQKFRACCVANDLLQYAVEKKDFLDASLGQETMKITKKCIPYKGDETLIQVEVSVKSDDEKVLWLQRRLVCNE